jgi:hypothetical protein
MWQLIAFIILVILAAAVCCGVTVNGRHYGCSGCDEDEGVMIDVGSDPNERGARQQ